MERENRKVLISVKVSTLLLILLSIIAIIVIGNIISNKIEENNSIAANTNNQENIQNEEIEENAEKDTKEEVRTIKAEITSRSQEQTRTEVNLQGNIGTIDIEHSIQEEFEQVEEVEEVQTTPIEEVTISRDMDLTVRTGLSREDFITLISGVKEDTSGFFEENAGLIFDICEKYQINEIFFCGLIAGESGWKIADNHRRTYNYISLMSRGGLIKYSSVEDGLEKAAMTLHNNYLTEGGRFYCGPTLAGVKTRFCPASSTWINLIYGNMEKIIK